MLKKSNQYDLSGQYGIGYTTNTNRPFFFDLNDYELICGYVWHEDTTASGYSSVRTTKRGKHIRMSTVLGYKYCDHINRDPFDNRRRNLREADKRSNAVNHNLPKNNTSGTCGISWLKNVSKWEAYIWNNCKKKRIGLFENKEEAISARKRAEQQEYGLEEGGNNES